jgi:4'-phosphopantetheinyl transferase EntD
VLDELLPPSVHTAEVYGDPPGLTLYPEEEAYVARAVEARRREFTTGRYCARTALHRSGITPAAIAKSPSGAPAWPDGVVGSITHCAGYRAAAVALTTDLITVGIDAEPAEPLPARVLDIITIPRERAELAVLADTWPGIPWDRLLFSAKESVYKAWAPLTGAFLDFDGADIRLDGKAGTFAARLLVPGARAVTGPGAELHGRFAVRNGLLVTAIACPACAGSRAAAAASGEVMR